MEVDKVVYLGPFNYLHYNDEISSLYLYICDVTFGYRHKNFNVIFIGICNKTKIARGFI